MKNVKPLLFQASSSLGSTAIARSYASTASSYRSRAYSASPRPVQASPSFASADVAALYASTAASNVFNSSRRGPLGGQASAPAAAGASTDSAPAHAVLPARVAHR